MVIEDFIILDAYDYLDYYETGHMPAVGLEDKITKGTFYSLDKWGDPYKYENRDELPNGYTSIYQIVKYAIPESTNSDINIYNINQLLDEYKSSMGW